MIKSRYMLQVVSFATVLIMGTVLSISSVSARPFRISKLPDKGKNFMCSTCHIDSQGGGARNPFGKDYERIAIPAGDKYTPELGRLDSDGDNFDNDQEFAAGKNPGDPASTPF